MKTMVALRVLTAAWRLLGTRLVCGQQGGDVYTETVEGKEYRIAPGEKPGTWLVSYGDDRLVWEPEPWMDKELVKEGPKLYLRWAKLGLIYPWDLSPAERLKLAKDDIWQFYFRYKAMSIFFGFAEGLADSLRTVLLGADGSRRTKILQEWGQPYMPAPKNHQYLTEAEKGVVSRKYLYNYREPTEVKGLGGRTVDYQIPGRRPDEWLYVPSVRKVRRSASAISQDYLPGTVAHFDQVSHLQVLPDLDYKFVGIELFKGDATIYGYDDESRNMTFKWADGRPQEAINGVGQLALVFEVTPKPGVSWWYARSVQRFGLHLGFWLGETAYNEKGEIIQTFALRPILPPPDVRQKHPQYIIYGQTFVDERTSGFKDYFWQEEILWEAQIPGWVFDPNTLVREPSSLLFW